MAIQFQSPIAAARRKERLAREQMAADFQIQAMRGEQDRIAAEQRSKQSMQRAALQHFLGQAQQFGGMDETIARQKNIMGEQRAQAAEAQKVKARPVQLRELESLTRQKETLENMIAMKNAIAAGEDPTKVKLVGPEISEERRTRMAAEAMRMSNEKAQLQLDNLNLQLQRRGTKQFQKGAQGVEGVSELKVKATTLKGARELGASYEMGDKPKGPSGKKKTKGALPSPPNPWHIYRPADSRIANVNALKQNASNEQINFINGYQKIMKQAHRVSLIRNPKKKKAALTNLRIQLLSGSGKTAQAIYHFAKERKLDVLQQIGVKMEGGDAWWGRAKGRTETLKAAERAAASIQESRNKANARANGVALNKMGLKKGMNPLGNKVADGTLKSRARTLADSKTGISGKAEAHYNLVVNRYEDSADKAKYLDPRDRKDEIMSKQRVTLRDDAWEELYQDTLNDLLEKFQRYRNAARSQLLKDAGLLESN